MPLLDVQAGQAVGNRLGPEAEVPQSHVALFSCMSVTPGLQLRCTGLLENNIKALLNLQTTVDGYVAIDLQITDLR